LPACNRLQGGIPYHSTWFGTAGALSRG
jgi:hypothetical protein